jgi:DNA polymerase-1
MMGSPLDQFDAVWLVDFEFGPSGGEGGAPEPRCVVAKEYKSGRMVRHWLDGTSGVRCPYDTGDRSLFVAYYASAETACHIALGWPMPRRILDLCAELKTILNGRRAVMDDYLKARAIGRAQLLGALYHFGLFDVAIRAAEKKEMQQLAIRGGPYSNDEREALLNYNESDVIALEALLPAMLPSIKHFGQALLRGRYAGHLGHLEYYGIPLDGPLFERLRDNWTEIVDRLIASESHRFDVLKRRDVDGEKFEAWLNRQGITYWPTTPSGKLATDSDTLKDMAKLYGGEVNELREFLGAVRQTRLFENLRVGRDGRNRFLKTPFGGKTGRDQPSSSRSIFGGSVWVRSLIRAPEGRSIAYCDFAGQEYAIAAYFSRDAKMIDDYCAGDCYLGFAKRVRIVPADATKATHGAIRSKLKVALGLGAIYGAGSETVANAGQMSKSEAQRYLALHRATYVDFWQWRQCVIHHAGLHNEMVTPFGWRFWVDEGVTPTTAGNWPMQSAAADMLRIAVCLILEAGVSVIGSLHDAVMIEAPIDEMDQAIAVTVAKMEEASRWVLSDAGTLGVDVDRFDHPKPFSDDRGAKMWNKIMELLQEVAPTFPSRVHPRGSTTPSFLYS